MAACPHITGFSLQSGAKFFFSVNQFILRQGLAAAARNGFGLGEGGDFHHKC
jgi:hypothetical protein